MKRNFYLLSFLLLGCLWPEYSSAMVNWCKEPHCKSSSEKVKIINEFRRTFSLDDRVSFRNRGVVTRKPRLRSAQDITVTYDDFLDHLDLDKSRNSKIIPYGNIITMDVKGIDEQGNQLHTWDMPNFADYDYLETAVEHVPLPESGFQDSFPNLTHAFYIEAVNAYELYELSPDDLFLYGFGDFDDNNQPFAEDYYSAISAVPLEWGLGYTGVITFVFEDDPDYDSIQYVQYYDVVATGTLNTYDDGPVEALKLTFTEEGKAYQDGIVVDQGSFDELLWYSKEGHLLRAGLKSDTAQTGLINLDYMEYQKIALKTTTATRNRSLQQFNYFPNPVAAGQMLTIEWQETQELGFADLIDAQGRILNRLDLSGISHPSSVQIDIPENLASGMYFYRLHDRQGALLGSGKLQVME